MVVSGRTYMRSHHHGTFIHVCQVGAGNSDHTCEGRNLQQSKGKERGARSHGDRQVHAWSSRVINVNQPSYLKHQVINKTFTPLQKMEPAG